MVRWERGTAGGPITVTQLVDRIRSRVESDPSLQSVAVIGELSGVKHHQSGHWYFTLKDAGAQLRAVLFRRDAVRLGFAPADGQAVLALGRIGVFERDGQTQLYVRHLEPVGLGAGFLRLEALKERLQAEGIFSREKRRLPLLPRRVGVVTSASGAVIHDIQTVVARRFPGMPVVLEPVQVQGSGAAEAIAAAIRRIARPPVDVLIVGRGGGSREDLMPFNEEAVVRAVAACPIPVISAVGHEVDVTLTDLAADVRAATPSAAAELAVPERDQLLVWCRDLADRAWRAWQRRLVWERERLSGWGTRESLNRPERVLEPSWRRLEQAEERIGRSTERLLYQQRERFVAVAATVRALDPEGLLRRGYAIVESSEGEPVTGRDIVPAGRYRVRWSDGQWWFRSEGEDSDGGGDPGL